MTAWKKIEADGKNCLRRSKGHLRKFSRTWDSNRQLMYGRVGRDTRNGIAEAYGIFRSLVSNILQQPPGAYFESKRVEGREIAGFLSDAVNYDFQVGNLRDRMVKALWQNFPYGFGAIAEQVETVHARDEKGEITGFGNKQRFFWRNVPVRDVLFDPDGFCVDLTDHRYVFISHYKTVRELRDARNNDGSKMYSNLENIDNMPAANETSRDRDGDRPGLRTGLSFAPPGPEDNNPDFHQLKLWRWYDRVNETISDFLDADGRLVMHQEWPLPIKVQGILQFPVHLLAMNPESDDFYPTPELDLLRPQMLNLIRLNDEMMTDLCSKIRKYIGLSPYLDPQKMGKLLDLKSPDKFVLTGNIDIAASQAGVPKIEGASDCISKLEDVQADPQLPHGMAEIRAQMQNIAAYGQASRGGLPQIRSAKEAARVADQVNRSLISRQSPLEQMTVSLAMYHVLLLKYAAPDDQNRYFRVTDKLSGIKSWLSYCPSQIPSEEDLFCDVFPGSSQPQTLDGKRAQFLEEMRVMAPILSEAKFSLIPLLYRYMEIFNVKYGDTLLKNQKGAAQEAMAALVRAGQLGDKAPPDLLIKALLGVIDSVLDPAEKQQVIQAMQQQGGSQGGGGSEAPNSGQLPSPTMGTQDGAAAS